ncbi:MAG: ATP-binding cassette domain-containing protein [Clostridia bacterium]|nr:ATP-binding cassette domain-containing protein [Clostridia bacterium]
MIELEKIPDKVLEIFRDKGILKENIAVCMMSDLDTCQFFYDNWVVLTDNEICCLTLTKNLKEKPYMSFADRFLSFGKKLETTYTEYNFRCFELKKIKKLKVEELISSCRLVAETEDDKEVVFYCTFSNKQNAFSFSSYANNMIKNGDIGEIKENRNKELFCPQCGTRFPEPERKICTRCMKKGKLIARLLPFFKRYSICIFLLFLGIILSTLLSIIIPYISGTVMYDDVLKVGGDFYGQLGLLLTVMIGTNILSSLFTVLNGIMHSKIAARVTYDLKKEIFNSIGKLSLGFFTSRQTGGLMTRINNDAETLYWFFCDGFPYLVTNIFQFIGIAVLMFTMSPILTFLTLIPVPVFVICYKIILKYFRKLHAKSFSKNRSFNAVITDVISGMRIVKVFAREKSELIRFNRHSKSSSDAKTSLAIAQNSVFPLIYYFMGIGSYIIWAYGGYLVIKGKMQYGELMTYTAFMGMIYGPLDFLAEVTNWWADCLNAVSRMFEIMDTEPDVKESSNAVSIHGISGNVEFRNVCFSYVKNRPVISDMSFEIKSGETLGIVGKTGAGKSTLANLLTRLYDTDSGEILIDGINIRNISFADLHNNIAIVSQETYFFRGSILENIRYAKPDASYEEIIEASKNAGAHSFIMKYPDGYNTQIGFGNRELSGGEKQRLSIARAILKKPKILILDEATAAMDTETERMIQNSITRITKNCTTLIIAHRLSTLRDAKKLIVIENGKITECGTHSELIAAQGGYFKLYTMQLEALKAIGIE